MTAWRNDLYQGINFEKELNQEDVIELIINSLQTEENARRSYSSYGYDLYLPNVMRKWLEDNPSIDTFKIENYLQPISSYFYNAAWELCRLGILRPGISNYGLQATQDGSAGNGYSITPFGKKWLSETDKDTFIPTEPGRFSEHIKPFARTFGGGFQERANQAIRCYGSHAYLACCVMCGASAESILLNLAIQKNGDEERVLKFYKAATGAQKIKNLIIGEQKESLKRDFESCFSLLKYWRDEAAHGRKSSISESEAFTSLSLLLRFAQVCKDNYSILTNSTGL